MDGDFTALTGRLMRPFAENILYGTCTRRQDSVFKRGPFMELTVDNLRV